jgi:hypothetical protein
LTRPKADLLQGTLDLLILKAQELMAKAGSKQLTAEEESWDRLALAIAKFRKAV